MVKKINFRLEVPGDKSLRAPLTGNGPGICKIEMIINNLTWIIIEPIALCNHGSFNDYNFLL